MTLSDKQMLHYWQLWPEFLKSDPPIQNPGSDTVEMLHCYLFGCSIFLTCKETFQTSSESLEIETDVDQKDLRRFCLVLWLG